MRLHTVRWRTAALIGAIGVAAGCAPAIQNSAEGIARLERAHAAQPKSEPATRSLGIAYYKANRLDDAHTMLTRAAAMNPGDGVAALYLGMTAEAQNDLATARTAYTSYLKVGRTRAVRRQLEQRLVVLQRKELEASTRAAVAQEASLSAVPGSPTTVAVLPFTFSGTDTTLEPLERGFAELLTTDLSRSSRLTVVERARLQAILDELALQRSGTTDSTTGVRAGRILQAGRLVGGSILQSGDELRADASVINVANSEVSGPSSTDQEKLDQLFTLEKNVALGLFQTLGVTLTTAERNAVEQRPTKSLAAFLSYSRGLTAQDAGQYQQANTFFNNAARLDPGFGAAHQKSQETRAQMTGAQVTSASMEASLHGTGEGAEVTAATHGDVGATNTTGNTVSQTADGLNPSTAGTATTAAGAGTTTTSATTATTTPPPSSTPQNAASGTPNTTPGATPSVPLVITQPGPKHP